MLGTNYITKIHHIENNFYFLLIWWLESKIIYSFMWCFLETAKFIHKSSVQISSIIFKLFVLRALVASSNM